MSASGIDLATTGVPLGRIQRRRTKGWRLPPNTVCVTRPGPYGNPYPVGSVDEVTGRTIDLDLSLRLFRGMFRQTAFWFWRKKARQELGGKWLACWCAPGKPCHADVIIEVLGDAEIRRYDEWREKQEAERAAALARVAPPDGQKENHS